MPRGHAPAFFFFDFVHLSDTCRWGGGGASVSHMQACDGFLLSFILTTFLAHSFFSYFLTTFFMQFLLFNYFFTEIHFFFIRGPKIGDFFASKKFPLRRSFFSPILCENCPLHFNYFFKVFQILPYISVCHLVIIHFGGYFFFAGEYIFCLYDVRIPIFSYFLTTFSS